MRQAVWRCTGVLGLAMLAACGGSDEQRATRNLNNRLEALLAPDIAAGQASVQALPDGARVTLMAPSADGKWGVGLDSRVSTVQALLNPELLSIGVANNTPSGTGLVQGLSILDWASVTQVDTATAPPGGIAVTIHVMCPTDEPIDGRPGCR
jgi:hypothetical protein